MIRFKKSNRKCIYLLLDQKHHLFSSDYPCQHLLIKIETNFIFPASNELVFINFYAEWCRFSNLLQPIFDEAADKVFRYHF